jgi:hypothetical protein
MLHHVVRTKFTGWENLLLPSSEYKSKLHRKSQVEIKGLAESTCLYPAARGRQMNTEGVGPVQTETYRARQHEKGFQNVKGEML